MKGSVFIYCCCITSNHALGSLKQPRLLFHSPVSQSQAGLARFSAWGSTQPKQRCWLGCAFIWRLWERIASKSLRLLAGCRSLGAEDCISLLAVNQGMIAASRSHSHSLPGDPSNFKQASKGASNSLWA